jgi:predicted TIM-barrel fold metal-dependent hydrolase
MKIIDTHVHFHTPGTRNQGAKDYLLKEGLVLAGTDGEYRGLKKYMGIDNVAVSVNAPVALSPEEAVSANRQTAGFDKKDPSVICLGAMHPGMDNPGKEIKYIAGQGFKGIKMHPQEQDFIRMRRALKPFTRHARTTGFILFFTQEQGQSLSLTRLR